MISNDEISTLKTRILYLESLLKQNNIPFDSSEQKIELEKEKPTLKSPFILNLETDQYNSLTTKLIERYSRQMILPEISLDGQNKINKTKILIVGAGGIGVTAIYYLAGLGIGKLGIIDNDTVDESNLHRQIIHNTKRKGMNKAESAQKSVKKFNPNINCVIYKERLSQKNAKTIIEQYDIVLDASDNAFTRYLLNDICYLCKKILVMGSALGWEGQLKVYGINNSACYRCLFPICPKANLMMSCGDSGVVGMVPGLIGILEAMEALKIIIGIEGILINEMLIYEGKRAKFKNIKLRNRQKDCILCGENPSLKNIEDFDYASFAGDGSCPIYPSLIPANNIDWKNLVDKFENFDLKECHFIDVRPESQFKICNLSKFINLPIEKYNSFDESEKEKFFENKNKKSLKFLSIIKIYLLKVFILCRRGNNSRSVAFSLIKEGYKNVFNIEGGINRYGDLGYADIPKI